MEFVFLGIGLVIGVVIGWLLGSRSAAPADNRVEAELRQQLAQRETELSQARNQNSEAARGQAAAEASRQYANDQASLLDKPVGDYGGKGRPTNQAQA